MSVKPDGISPGTTTMQGYGELKQEIPVQARYQKEPFCWIRKLRSSVNSNMRGGLIWARESQAFQIQHC